MLNSAIYSMLIFLLGQPALAEFIAKPRTDWIQSQKTLSQKFLLKTTIDGSMEFGEKTNGKFFIESYVEKDFCSLEQKFFRDAKDRGEVQEMYFEIQFLDFYLRLGRQALRWSESWVVPSLDVWTARKYERLFIDPLTEQLTHSTGATLAFNGKSLGFELVFFDPAQDSFPAVSGLEQLAVEESDQFNFGGRIKYETKMNSSVGALFARKFKKLTSGIFYTHAFEEAVFKTEAGRVEYQWTKAPLEEKQFYFASVGFDIFLGSHVITPQLTLYEPENPYQKKSLSQSLGYLSWSYDAGKHRFLTQGFHGFLNRNQFFGAEYGFDLFQNLELVFLAQYYKGESGQLSSLYQEYTDSSLYGLRINGFWSF